MNSFITDILEQPQYLSKLIEYYENSEGRNLLERIMRPNLPIFTGMGASFHAALTQIPQLHMHNIPTTLIESIDLLNYGASTLTKESTVIFISQSGNSAEVQPLINQTTNLIAITNEEKSPLADKAKIVLPVMAGPNEANVASRTYINSMAVLWLLVRKWCGVWDGTEFAQLNFIKDRCAALIDNRDEEVKYWMSKLGTMHTLIFVGHGPHTATAKQAAMMLGEWAKTPAHGFGIGAFRHGPIEMIEPGVGVIVFAAPGRTDSSALNLAAELSGYGAEVLVVENGITRRSLTNSCCEPRIDEFLSPILDVIPAQLFVEAYARQNHIQPDFRHIHKVVTKL